MQKLIQPQACLDHSLHVLKPRSFQPNLAPKMRERHQLFCGLWFMSKEFRHPPIQTKIEQHFGGLFHQIRVRQLVMSTIPKRKHKRSDIGANYRNKTKTF
jgi:hypothetical protein